MYLFQLTMRVLLLLTLVAAAFAAVPGMGKRVPTRIVGGTPTTIQQYPYMSNMQYLLWGFMWTQFCGGSLITSTAVLSAAHCYVGDHHSQWSVRLGSSYASSGGIVYNVAQLIIHAQYNNWNIDNDIAIVKLASSAVLNGQTIGTVAIPASNYNLADGIEVYTIGWGALTSGGSSPEQLQHVAIHIINQNICAQRYGANAITENMLCAGILDAGGKDACQGDSGGPLIYKDSQHILSGIVSWGIGCAHAYYPGVNTRVSRYTDWVIANA